MVDSIVSYFSLFLIKKGKKNKKLPISQEQAHSSGSSFCYLYPLAQETQGARQAQAKTQEVDGYVTLPRPAEHHGAGQGEGACLFFCLFF